MPNLLTNPQDFKRKCDDVGVTYDLLIEAQQCLGKQGCSKLLKDEEKVFKHNTKVSLYII